MWIQHQTEEWLICLSYLWDIKVEGNAVTARNPNGEKIVLGEYYGEVKAEKVINYVKNWMRFSAGPENPIFVMPKC